MFPLGFGETTCCKGVTMFKTLSNRFFVLMLIFGLVACGGGGSESTSSTSVATASLVLPQQLEVVTNETE